MERPESAPVPGGDSNVLPESSPAHAPDLTDQPTAVEEPVSPSHPEAVPPGDAVEATVQPEPPPTVCSSRAVVQAALDPLVPAGAGIGGIDVHDGEREQRDEEHRERLGRPTEYA